ncbi:MAG TPA: hypothetical protein VFB54_06580 [Burkholderiales bacterium]|nr:hypothetical protein [Burkholderiales bacterium]
MVQDVVDEFVGANPILAAPAMVTRPGVVSKALGELNCAKV